MTRKSTFISPKITVKKLTDYAKIHDIQPGNKKYFISDRSRDEYGIRFTNILETIYRRYHIGRLEYLKPEYFTWYMTAYKSGVTRETKQKFEDIVLTFQNLAKDMGLIPSDTEKWIANSIALTFDNKIEFESNLRFYETKPKNLLII